MQHWLAVGLLSPRPSFAHKKNAAELNARRRLNTSGAIVQFLFHFDWIPVVAGNDT